MQTLTLYIENIFSLELGSEPYQLVENKSLNSASYVNIVLAGAMIKETVLEDLIFEDCIFFGSTLQNCLFINCLFINCKFQFSKFSDCNFESTLWENCKWGLSTLNDTEMALSEGCNNYAFITKPPLKGTQPLNLNEFLALPA